MDDNSTKFRLGQLSEISKTIKIAVGIVCFATILIPLFLSIYNYSTRQLFLAMVLLDVCLYPTLRYFATGQRGLPVLPVLCLAFAVQYAIPIFTQEPRVSAAYDFRYLEDSDIVWALILSILGVFVMELGYYYFRRSKVSRVIPVVRMPLNKRKSEVYCVLMFLLFVTLGRLQPLLSDKVYLQFSAIIGLLQNQILIAIAITSSIVFSKQGGKWHRVLLFVLVTFAAIKGFSTTMLELMMLPITVLLMTKWFYHRRVPIGPIIMIGALFLFLSPVKRNIRSAMGDASAGSREISTASRALDWTDQAFDYWQEVFQGKRDFVESTSDASSRADLIHNFAYIYSLTPSEVPYQWGKTYSYLAVAWIPRALWPEKPQANFANNFYAVEYEISTEDGIRTSSFGASLVGEGYMNFGFVGVLGIMLLLGLVVSILEHVFASQASGVGGQAIFLATFVYFLNGIGSSTELLFGGLLQSLIANSLLLWWARERPVPRFRSFPTFSPSSSQVQ